MILLDKHGKKNFKFEICKFWFKNSLEQSHFFDGTNIAKLYTRLEYEKLIIKYLGLGWVRQTNSLIGFKFGFEVSDL